MFFVLKTESRVLIILGKPSPTELYSQHAVVLLRIIAAFTKCLTEGMD